MTADPMRTRTIAAATVAAFAFASIAVPSNSIGASAGDMFSGDCNPIVTGVIGGLLGALVGGRSHRGGGAAIGAGVGALACMAYNYTTSQTKSAQQVETEYKAANNGTLPAAATVTRFNAQVNPNDNVQSGTAVDVKSQIEVVPGTNDPQPKVEQEIALYAPDGKETAKARKPAAQSPGGGGFETNFKFTMPQGVPQGVYPVKSQVYVNNEPAANTETRFQVVIGPQRTIVAVLR
jgi:hypothetical protein